ncbi:MAG: hypothetical protein ACI81T_004593 [Bacteroidia bacterium]|jgi:hypothetical protein
MASSLTDNLNSGYLEAFSDLFPSSGEHVLVYVESDEDIAFWSHLLSPLQNSRNIHFDIQTSSNDTLAKGKTEVLKFSNRVGKHLILGVDSDCDYLLQDSTEQSQLLNQNQFIFQTYVFSIENYLCYSESLKGLCVQATKNSKITIDFVKFFERYSEIIFPLFLWLIHFQKLNDTETFNQSDFLSIVKIPNRFNTNFKMEELLALQERVNLKLSQLKTSFPEQIEEAEAIIPELEAFGLKPTNTYLFVQGHALKDKVVLLLLNPVCHKLKNERFRIIASSEATRKVKTDNRRLYERQTQIGIEDLISNHTEYKSSAFYQKIQSDLEKHVELFD